MAYTVIDDPSAHFQADAYTGTGTSAMSLSGNSDLQPDFIWAKRRTVGYDQTFFDSSRGGSSLLGCSSTAAENTNQTWISSFNSDGFTAGLSEHAYSLTDATYAGYFWKANGGTTSTNTDGDIDTTVQVNSDAGFSIVTYSPPNDTARTIGHGLGAIPRFIIIKARNRVENWHVFHYSNGTGGMILDNATAFNNNSVLGDTLPTSSVYKLGTDWRMNGSYNYVGYFFADVQGFSKFGSYLGNGEALNGPFVYTGFKPAFIIIKHTSTTNRAWYMFDAARNPHNPNGLKFYADTAAAEGTDQSIYMMSNGFQVSPSALGSYGTDSVNSSGNKMIYAAWAENPFVTSGGTPATAR
jgi:hypothetical protein|tara:strand:- start:118 stop:1176 length:1059 start_codon:yes stop_codon:yes gene_type:complete